MSGLKPEKDKGKYTFEYALASVTAQVGCFTVVLTLGAFAVGYYVDQLIGSSPWLALILMIGSVPFNLYLIYRMVTKTTSQMAVPLPNNSEETPKKEKDIDRKE